MSSPVHYRALHEGAGLFERTDRGRLLLTGSDRRSYLQGLLTNDVAALEPGTGCYSAYLTAQGRMIADMRVFETGDAVLVDLDAAVAPSVRDRWTQFIFSEDVTVQDLSASTAQIGIYGPSAASALAAALASASQEGGSALTADALNAMAPYANTKGVFDAAPVFVLRSDDAGVPGFDVVCPSELKPALLAALRRAGAVDVGPGAVETARVEAGRPLFRVDMDEETIPLEAGIEDRAISLTKGCYVGQEIIIRVLHRGHGRVARRLVGLTFDPTAIVPSKGDVIRAGAREVGAVTSGVRSPVLDRPIALGYVHRDFVAPGTELTVGDARATVTALPFLKS